jgi:MraZ protein
VNERGLFRGYALNAIDAKGRVAIPAPFRKIIELNSKEPFLVIAKHDADPCLAGYDREWAKLLQARIDREEERALDAGTQFDLHNANRRAFTLAEDAGFDASGRFIMPRFFLDKVKLADWVLFLGTGNCFEMWNPHILIAHESVDSDTKDLVCYLLTERGVAG